MKTYYKNYTELTDDWVKGETPDRAHTAKNRMICWPEAIYSYGLHFCIARKWTAPDTGRLWYLATLRSFSPTTSTHCREVFRAIRAKHDESLVYLPQVDDLPLKSFRESDLGDLVYEREVNVLKEHAEKYLRSIHPLPLECVDAEYRNAAESVARFGRELPASSWNQRDQLAVHYHRRAVRNRELAATYPQRRLIKQAKQRLVTFPLAA